MSDQDGKRSGDQPTNESFEVSLTNLMALLKGDAPANQDPRPGSETQEQQRETASASLPIIASSEPSSKKPKNSVSDPMSTSSLSSQSLGTSNVSHSNLSTVINEIGGISMLPTIPISGDVPGTSLIPSNSGLSMEKQREEERRVRRQIANSNERRRMQSINNGFMSLRTIIPDGHDEKLSKAAVLQQTAAYVRQLEKDKLNLIAEIDRLKRGDASLTESEPQPSLVNQLNGDSNDIGIMSAAQLRKEILSVRLQLERERDLRLKHEAKIKELETLLYPSRLKQATVEAQKKIRAELLREQEEENSSTGQTCLSSPNTQIAGGPQILSQNIKSLSNRLGSSTMGSSSSSSLNNGKMIVSQSNGSYGAIAQQLNQQQNKKRKRILSGSGAAKAGNIVYAGALNGQAVQLSNLAGANGQKTIILANTPNQTIQLNNAPQIVQNPQELNQDCTYTTVQTENGQLMLVANNNIKSESTNINSQQIIQNANGTFQIVGGPQQGVIQNQGQGQGQNQGQSQNQNQATGLVQNQLQNQAQSQIQAQVNAQNQNQNQAGGSNNAGGTASNRANFNQLPNQPTLIMQTTPDGQQIISQVPVNNQISGIQIQNQNQNQGNNGINNQNVNVSINNNLQNQQQFILVQQPGGGTTLIPAPSNNNNVNNNNSNNSNNNNGNNNNGNGNGNNGNLNANNAGNSVTNNGNQNNNNANTNSNNQTQTLVPNTTGLSVVTSNANNQSQKISVCQPHLNNGQTITVQAPNGNMGNMLLQQVVGNQAQNQNNLGNNSLLSSILPNSSAGNLPVSCSSPRNVTANGPLSLKQDLSGLSQGLNSLAQNQIQNQVQNQNQAQNLNQGQNQNQPQSQSSAPSSSPSSLPILGNFNGGSIQANVQSANNNNTSGSTNVAGTVLNTNTAQQMYVQQADGSVAMAPVMFLKTADGSLHPVVISQPDNVQGDGGTSGGQEMSIKSEMMGDDDVFPHQTPKTTLAPPPLTSRHNLVNSSPVPSVPQFQISKKPIANRGGSKASDNQVKIQNKTVIKQELPSPASKPKEPFAGLDLTSSGLEALFGAGLDEKALQTLTSQASTQSPHQSSSALASSIVASVSETLTNSQSGEPLQIGTSAGNTSTSPLDVLSKAINHVETSGEKHDLSGERIN